MKAYVVDTNFFIQAHRTIYPLDVATSFWSKVRQLAEEGKIVCIDKVRVEIFSNEDSLKHWCTDNLPEHFFKDTSSFVSEYSRVATWATSQNNHYLQNAVTEFLDADEADSHLIVYCLAETENRTLVTQETREPNRRNKIKIPDVCDALSVRCINVIEMFRELGETF